MRYRLYGVPFALCFALNTSLGSARVSCDEPRLTQALMVSLYRCLASDTWLRGTMHASSAQTGTRNELDAGAAAAWEPGEVLLLRLAQFRQFCQTERTKHACA